MPDFPLTITAWTALINAALMLALAFQVSRVRRAKKIVLGDGGDKQMTKIIRGHANATEQVPIALIILGLTEWLLHPSAALAIAVILTAGRISHAIYFAFDGTTWRFRFWGATLTIIAQALGIACVAVGLIF